MDVSMTVEVLLGMTQSVAFYANNKGNFLGFFTINTTSIYAVFLELCLVYAYNKVLCHKPHNTTRMDFFMLNLCVICREHIQQI